jgi:hypothetical protein
LRVAAARRRGQEGRRAGHKSVLSMMGIDGVKAKKSDLEERREGELYEPRKQLSLGSKEDLKRRNLVATQQ